MVDRLPRPTEYSRETIWSGKEALQTIDSAKPALWQPSVQLVITEKWDTQGALQRSSQLQLRLTDRTNSAEFSCLVGGIIPSWQDPIVAWRALKTLEIIDFIDYPAENLLADINEMADPLMFRSYRRQDSPRKVPQNVMDVVVEARRRDIHRMIPPDIEGLVEMLIAKGTGIDATSLAREIRFGRITYSSIYDQVIADTKAAGL